MPILNEKQKLIGEGISQEVKKESSGAVVNSYLNSMAVECFPECLINKSASISKAEKNCLLTCFRRRNMAVKSFMKNLVDEETI